MAYNNFQRKNHIREIQGYLYSISFFNDKIPIVIPDGIYGRETTIAVKAFQQEYGLAVTGEVNRATWDKIVSVYKGFTQFSPITIEPFPQGNFTLKQGSRGYEVYILQTMLNALSEKYKNLPKTDINGVYDTKTTNAVKVFQNISKLEITGILDRLTGNIIAKCFNKMQYSKSVNK